MNTPRFDADAIKGLLNRQKVATLDELKIALGTRAPATVFRKLGEFAYHSSYSHGGRYYTLNEIARFDAEGLWWFGSIGFSRCGTLLATLTEFIERSKEGCFSGELKERLQVEVQPSLLKLVNQGKVGREKVVGLYLYCSAEASVRQRQVANRRAQSIGEGTRGIVTGTDWVSDDIKAAIILFVSLLDEQQRRLFAGLESLQFGHGGDSWIAELLGLDPHTVAKGRRQILERDVLYESIRAPGAGRPGVKKTPRE